MAIDRYDWHSGGDFPEELPDEAGGTHIGFFIYWLLSRGFAGDELLADEITVQDISMVSSGGMTGRQFLFKNCDGKLWDVDISVSIIKFVKWYYGENKYYEDLEGCLDKYETIYHADDSLENAKNIAKIIDDRYKKWTSKIAQQGDAPETGSSE